MNSHIFSFLRSKLAPVASTRFSVIAAAAFAISTFSACAPMSALEEPETIDAQSGDLKIDLFSARGFLGGSEYERYYLTGNILWRECGSISAAGATKKVKLEGDQVLSRDPQLSIQERRVEKLSRDAVRAVRVHAAKVLEARKAKKIDEPPPGSVFSLKDPGLFEMLVQVGGAQDRIISSVDAVADKRTDTLDKANELFAILRGVGPEICGSKTFYGIGRQEF